MVSKLDIQEYPFFGTFYETVKDGPYDGDILNGAEKEYDEVLLDTPCDIERNVKKDNNGTITSEYTVYIPCEVGSQTPVKFNCSFKSDDYAFPVQGNVVGMNYSQLGAMAVDIKMREE